MGYTQIVLGGRLRGSRESDIRKFIKNKGDRLGSLTGSSTNNAIVMRIGAWLFVEFSEKGNACYRFPMSQEAIDLEQKTYSLANSKATRD